MGFGTWKYLVKASTVGIDKHKYVPLVYLISLKHSTVEDRNYNIGHIPTTENGSMILMTFSPVN